MDFVVVGCRLFFYTSSRTSMFSRIVVANANLLPILDVMFTMEFFGPHAQRGFATVIPICHLLLITF